jgi:ribosomal protein L12E/L44/L45/RPP1/RPP2
MVAPRMGLPSTPARPLLRPRWPAATKRSIRGRRALPALLALGIALGPIVNEGVSEAGKEPPRTASQDRAAAAYETALKLYKNGQYRAAVDKLIEARKLDPTAKLLPYNLGLLYEKLGELDNAIKNFQLYVSLETDEADRERVKSIIQRLEGARADLARSAASAEPVASASAPAPPAESSAPEPSAAPPEAPPPPRKKGRLDGWVYGTAGLAVVGLAAGTFLGLQASSQRPSDVTTGMGKTIDDLRAEQDRAHRTAVFADVSFGVAVLAGGAAAVLYFTRESPAPRVTGVLVPQPGGAALGLSGRF